MPDEKASKPTDMFKSLRDKAVDKAMPDEVPEYRLGESVDPAFTEREARRVARPDVQAGRYKKHGPELDLMADYVDLKQNASRSQLWATEEHLAKIFEAKNGPASPEDLKMGDWEALKQNPRMATELYNKGLLGAGFYDHITSWMKDADHLPISMPLEDDTWQTTADQWQAHEARKKRQGD